MVPSRNRKMRSLLKPLSLIVAASVPANALCGQAQYGVRPYVGDLPPAGSPELVEWAGYASPMLNIPDGLWNHGEGFAPSGSSADYGG